MTVAKETSPPKINARLGWLTAISIFEALVVLISLFLIPPDPKNALLLGYSWKRWLIFLSAFLMFGSLLFVYNKPKYLRKRVKNILGQGKVSLQLEVTGVLSTILLWISFWLPPERLLFLGDSYIRLRPLIILILLLIVQFYVFLQIAINFAMLTEQIQRISGYRKSMIAAIVITILLVAFFVMLNKAQLTIGKNSFYFPPSSILSALQVFSVWMVFYGLQLISGRNFFERFANKKWLFLAAFLIWLSTFLIWNATPFACSNDRPGPDLPNMVCYPPIDDSVYSIGSLYTRLGEGVHNHWSTDKPLLLIVLALGQTLFGPNIDQYLIFQIALIAIIPALLFYIGSRFISVPGGVLLAALAALKGVNEIRLYRSVGGMNVKIENTELFMALVLLLLTFALYRWFLNPIDHKWGVISGGILGLGVLVRFNPIGMIPVVFLVLIFINRGHWRRTLIGFALFSLALVITTAPWFITARDANGNNYYYLKIKDVLSSRYIQLVLNEEDNLTPPLFTPAATVISELTPEIQSTAGTMMPEMTPETQPPAAPVINTRTSGQAEDILLHFFNNQFSAIAELPINYSFIKRTTITGQPLWDLRVPKPLWLTTLSIENKFMLAINLLLVVSGILLAYQKWGIPGLTPLVIQSGYFLGNAAAMTSGERYLLPVNWVTLIYYCVALVALSNFLFRILLPQQWPAAFNTQSFDSKPSAPQSTGHHLRQTAIIMGAFLLIGFIPYALDFLPDRLPPETSQQVSATAYHLISEQSSLSNSVWQRFLNNPAAIVMQGKAYHPRIYKSNSYFPGETLFELMVLGKDFVYVSEMLNSAPEVYFSDESDVILAGCILRADEVWGSKRKILQTFAVIQLDHEKQIYTDPQAGWTCQNP